MRSIKINLINDNEVQMMSDGITPDEAIRILSGCVHDLIKNRDKKDHGVTRFDIEPTDERKN